MRFLPLNEIFVESCRRGAREDNEPATTIFFRLCPRPDALSTNRDLCEVDG